MKQNYTRVKNAILNITDDLKNFIGWIQHAEELNENISKNEDISEKKKSKEKARVDDDLKRWHNQLIESITENLEVIEESEKREHSKLEYDGALDLESKELTNALNIINSAKGKLPREVVESIKKTFAGDKTAMLAFKAILEEYGVNTDYWEFDEYLADTEEPLEKLYKQAKDLVPESSAYLMQIRKLFNDIIRYGETIGIKFEEDERTFPFDDEVNQIAFAQGVRQGL